MEIGNLRKGKKPTIFKKKKGERNAHQHAYDCCRLRLSAQIKSATHKREKWGLTSKEIDESFFPFQLIMRTMIQPSHRTVCSSFLFFLLFFPPFFSVKKKRKRRRIKKKQNREPSCACFFVAHAHYFMQREQNFCTAVVCAWSDRTQSLISYTAAASVIQYGGKSSSSSSSSGVNPLPLPHTPAYRSA